MENSGQPAGFYGGNKKKMVFPSDQNTGTSCDSTDFFDMSEFLESPQNPSMGTQIFKCGQPAGTILGIGCPDQTNTNDRRTATFDSQQQHGQPAGMIPQFGFPDQPNINVPRTRPLRMTKEEHAARKREIDRKSREKKKQKEINMQSEMQTLKDELKKLIELQSKVKILQDENTELREHKETLQSKAEKMDELKSLFDELKTKHEKQEALVQGLLEQQLKKDEDLKFIKQGYKHHKKPTHDSFSSDEERYSREESSPGMKDVDLDGGDSEAENDSRRKKKRTVRSSERHSGKETRQVALAAKKEWCDAGAERYGSTSYPTTKVDPYSITECLRILKSMKDIKYATVKKATAKFKSPDERETFVGLTDDWRKDWVKDLDNDA